MWLFRWIRNIFKTKKINMITLNKMKDLKKINKEIKDEIDKHYQNNPTSKDTKLNFQLYGVLEAAINIADDIAKQNNKTLD